MSYQEVFHLRIVLLSFGVVCALAAILMTMIRARDFSLFRMYGWGLFGIYHVAQYGERRDYSTRPWTRD